MLAAACSPYRDQDPSRLPSGKARRGPTQRGRSAHWVERATRWGLGRRGFAPSCPSLKLCRPAPINTVQAMAEISPQTTLNASRLLVIEDDATERRHLREILEAAPLMATVTEADDGAVALRLALEHEFDCVLCDVTMPRLDGISFLRLIRVQRSPLELPIVLITVRSALADRIGSFRCGASDFVNKPFEPLELVARIETQVNLARMYRDVSQMAHYDPLTGARNRRRLMEDVQREVTRARRFKRNLAIALFDLDHFKSINDTYGHPVGDSVLVDFVQLIDKHRRAYDTLGRVGGEEFAMLLPEITPSDAVKVAERLRQAIACASLGGLRPGAVTASIGLAGGPLDASDAFETLLARADKSLYEAKNGGRNRVCGLAPEISST